MVIHFDTFDLATAHLLMKGFHHDFGADWIKEEGTYRLRARISRLNNSPVVAVTVWEA